MAREASFRYPVAIDAALHVRLTPNEFEESKGQSYDGRLWDLLYVGRFAAKSANGPDAYYKIVLAEQGKQRNRLVQHPLHLRMNIGPGDQAEPVITIGLPENF